MVKKIIKNTEYIFASLCLLFILVMLIIYRSSVASGVYGGISYSLSILIPSIMPFMFVSSVFSMTNSSKFLCKLFSWPMEKIFRLPAAATPAVLFGLTCGYPVGSKLAASLLERGEIDESQAGRLLIFTLNPGIPFCVLFVGGASLGSVSLGWLFYMCLVISSIILGILTGIGVKKPEKSNLVINKTSFFAALRGGTDSTIRACLNMCFYVVIFWGILSVLHSCGAYQFIVKNLFIPFLDSTQKAGALSFIAEVTSGIKDSITLRLSPMMFLFGLSFGGICIHLQIFSFFRKAPISYIIFLLWRGLHCFISLCIYSLIYPLFCGHISAMSTTATASISSFKGNFFGSLCLILLFVVYVLIISKETVEKSVKK